PIANGTKSRIRIKCNCRRFIRANAATQIDDLRPEFRAVYSRLRNTQPLRRCLGERLLRLRVRGRSEQEKTRKPGPAFGFAAHVGSDDTTQFHFVAAKTAQKLQTEVDKAPLDS